MIRFEFPIYEFAPIYELGRATRDNRSPLTARRGEYEDAIKRVNYAGANAYLAAYMRVAS